MVEFDSIESAEKAKNGLHDQDIYSGCCTLKVDFSRTTKLNVKENNMNTWDFTIQPQLTAEATKQPLISNQPGSGPAGYNAGYNQGGYDRYNQGAGGYGGNQNYGGHNMNNSYNSGYGGGYNNQGGPGGYYPQQGERTPVAICYGLTPEVNCTHLFNILCLYGNVKRIKFMKSKQGCAMIEFADTEAVTKACKFTGQELFGSKLTIRPSKSKFVGEPKGEAFNLNDNPETPGFEDFSRSKFNRFTNPDKASKNRFQEARNTIHFFNAPRDSSEEDIKQFIEENNEGPCNIENFVMFPQKEGAKSQAGLLTFSDVETAVNVMAKCNHKSMDSQESSYPYNVKLCFATNAEHS